MSCPFQGNRNRKEIAKLFVLSEERSSFLHIEDKKERKIPAKIIPPCVDKKTTQKEQWGGGGDTNLN